MKGSRRERHLGISFPLPPYQTSGSNFVPVPMATTPFQQPLSSPQFLLGFSNTSCSPRTFRPQSGNFLLLVVPKCLPFFIRSPSLAIISVCGPFIKLSSSKPAYSLGQGLNLFFLKHLSLRYKQHSTKCTDFKCTV